MADDDARRERKALTFSIAATTILGALGIVWGVLSGSQMILLDGAYGIVGTITSWLLLKASALSVEGPSRRYPFGRESATPLAIGVQGFVMFATLLYAGYEALLVIVDGGSEVTAGPAIVYAVIVTASCVGVWLWLQRTARGSELLLAEATGWRIAALRGVGMVVGFALLMVLVDSRWEDAAPYVDPGMVLLTCALFIATPIGMMRSTIVELMEGSPGHHIQGPVDEAVAAVVKAYDLDTPDVRVNKIGPKLYVEINGTAGPDVTIKQEHEVRENLRERLEALPYEIWLNLELLPRNE